MDTKKLPESKSNKKKRNYNTSPCWGGEFTSTAKCILNIAEE